MKKHILLRQVFCLFLATNFSFAQTGYRPEEANQLLEEARERLAGNRWQGAFDLAFEAAKFMEGAPSDNFPIAWFRAWSDFMWLAETRKQSGEVLAGFARQLPDGAPEKTELLLLAADHYVFLPKNDQGREYLVLANQLRATYQPDDERLQALRHFIQGTYDNNSRKRVAEGLMQIDSALALMEKIGMAETVTGGQTRLIRSFLLFHSKKWKESEAECGHALAIFREQGTLRHLYEGERFLGGIFTTRGMPGEAIPIRRHTSEWLRQSTPFFQQTLLPQALNSLGIDLKNSGQYTEAQKCYEEGLKIFDHSGLLPGVEANLETNLGVIFHRKGHIKESLLHIRRGLDIIVRIHGPESDEAAKRYANLAVSYYLAGDNDQAEIYALKCLSIWQKANTPPALIFSPYSTLFNVAEARGDLPGQERWLVEVEKCFSTFPQNVRPDMWINYAYMVGGYLPKVGRAGEAVQKIEDLLRQYPPPADEWMPVVWANAYAALGFAKMKTGNFEGAANEYTRAWRSSFYQKDNRFHYVYRSNFEKHALHIAEVYINYLKKSPEPRLLDSAIFYQNIALRAMMGKALFGDETLTEMDEAFSGFSTVTGIGNCKALYQITGDMVWLKKAVDLNEATAVQNLRRYLRENPGLVLNGLTEETLSAETDLRIRIAQTETEEFTALLKADGNTSDTTYLRYSDHLLQLHEQYAALRQEMAQNSPAFDRLHFTLPFFGADSLQTRMLSHEQCYFQFFHDAILRRLEVQLLRRDTIIGFFISTDARFDSALTIVQRNMQLPSFNKKQSDDYIAASNMLYDSIFGRVASFLTTEIFIAPDAYLSALSFDGLLKSTPAHENIVRPHTWQYLGLYHAISYLSAASLYRYQQLREPLHPNPEPFIGFAPFYSGDTTALAEAFPDLGTVVRRDLYPLPYSGSEVAKLAKITGGQGFYGKAAKKSKFLELAPSAKIIHLATHGQANRQLGDFSFLAFSEHQKDREKSLLFARELYNLPLSAELVVLSACETGLGKYGQGEGIIGFSRALSCAGAQSLIASLWNVNDKRTQTIMLLFYKELKKGAPKNIALWKAKKAFLADYKPEAEPYFWAALTLFGDISPIQFR